MRPKDKVIIEAKVGINDGLVHCRVIHLTVKGFRD